MRFGDATVNILSDGSFSLEVGACFGVVPKKIWSRSIKENEKNRVTMALNIPVIQTPEWTAIIDSGIGKIPEEKVQKIYEAGKSQDLLDGIDQIADRKSVKYIVHSHLHFDHMGHSFELIDGKDPFPEAVRIFQADEKNNMLHQNEVTRGSYNDPLLLGRGFKTSTISGSTDIKEGLRAVHTGGHTSGHQAIIFERGGNGLIYFGDILPTSFNLKLPYITAIDTYPLETLEMKRKLIQLALDKNYICVFNHDSTVKAGYLNGTIEKVTVQPVEL